MGGVAPYTPTDQEKFGQKHTNTHRMKALEKERDGDKGTAGSENDQVCAQDESGHQGTTRPYKSYFRVLCPTFSGVYLGQTSDHTGI